MNNINDYLNRQSGSDEFPLLWDTKQYFKEVQEKFNNMSDEEFLYLIDSTIEQTELIGGLTTNIRADVLMTIMKQEIDYIHSQGKITKEEFDQFIRGLKSSIIFYDEYRELDEENERIVKEYLNQNNDVQE